MGRSRWNLHRIVATAEESIGMNLEGNVSVSLNTMASDDVGDDLSLDVKLLPNLSRPPRRYDPHGRSPAPQVGNDQSVPKVNGHAPSPIPGSGQLQDDDRPVDPGTVTARQDGRSLGLRVS